MSKLVHNIEPASPSMISSLDRHCLNRTPDGTSNIDVSRSHRNTILVGDERGLTQSLKNFYASGIQKPAKQSESPYLRIVLSASPSYFRPNDPKEVGTWDDDRLAKWKEASMGQLQKEYTDDLVFAEIHLDEDTPHIHAVVAPTYFKKPRKPGKQKRKETLEEFEIRKAQALASKGVRTVGRASHPTLSQKGSFQQLRARMAIAVEHLGIEYGEDRSIDAPKAQSTREWVTQQAAELRVKQEKLDKERIEFEEYKRATKTKFEATNRWIEYGLKNLVIALNRVLNGSYDTEVHAEDMKDKPEHFVILKAAAPDSRPTFGFRVQFWALHSSRTGTPSPIPENIRSHLQGTFDKVASWAAEVRKARKNIDNILKEPKHSAKTILDTAHENASKMFGEAKSRAESMTSIKALNSARVVHVNLMKEKFKSYLDDNDYKQLMKDVDDSWANHPANPERPLPKSAPVTFTPRNGFEP